jgi:hypothetical protein
MFIVLLGETVSSAVNQGIYCCGLALQYYAAMKLTTRIEGALFSEEVTSLFGLPFFASIRGRHNSTSLNL